MSLFDELKRRNVFRVAAAYAVVAWLLLQAADIMLENFGSPAWVFKSFTVLLALGLPVAVFFAWAFELTPDGIKTDADARTVPNHSVKPNKSIDRVIVIGLLAVIAVMAVERVWLAGSASEPPSPPAIAMDAAASSLQSEPLSIAVLPFENMSADAEQEFFADGMTEDILTRLAGINDLRVISRTTVMRYKGSEMSLPAIAAELGVTHVLEGSVRRAGNQVRITGQLIRARDDAHLWAASFDRELVDIFAMQAEIAGQIVEALQLQLTDDEQERLVQRGTDSTEAYEQYLLGRALLNTSWSTREEQRSSTAEAERHFRAAVDYDPEYAEPWVGLARIALSRVYRREDIEANYQATLDAARRAVILAPRSASGYVGLGSAYLARGQIDAATEQYRLAAEIEPDSIEVLQVQANLSSRVGRLAEAIRLMERAAQIDPADPFLFDRLGRYATELGDLQRAHDAYSAAWERITPHPARLACMLSGVAAYAGDRAASDAYAARMQALEPDVPVQGLCTIAQAFQFRKMDVAATVFNRFREPLEEMAPLISAQVLAQFEPATDIEPLLARSEAELDDEMPRPAEIDEMYTRAQIAVLRGNHGAAMDLLERAVARGWRQYRVLSMSIIWDPIRDEPRFQALERLVEEDLARQRAELAAD